MESEECGFRCLARVEKWVGDRRLFMMLASSIMLLGGSGECVDQRGEKVAR